MAPLLLAALAAPQVACAQSYSPLYAPGYKKYLWAGCRGFPGGELIPYCNLRLMTGVYTIDSNGHSAAYHTSPFPKSGISLGADCGSWRSLIDNVNTGPTGQVLFCLGAGQRTLIYSTDVRRMVGHEEYISNCPLGGVCYIYDYAVGYSDLLWVEEKPQWIHVGATPKHMNSNSYNHWMTSAAAWGIYYTAVDYLSLHPEQGRIAVNDMALPFGGLFDISGGWEPSHWEHGRGTAVDVRGNGQLYAIPDARQNEFVAICVAKGATWGQVEYPGTPEQHIHCQWPNP